MFQQFPDFTVEGSLQKEGFNLPRQNSNADQVRAQLEGIETSYSGPFAPLLVNDLKSRKDKQLLVIVTAVPSSIGQPVVNGWLILEYVGDREVEALGFLNNSEEAFWMLSKEMKRLTGRPLTQQIDTSETISRPPEMDFRS